MNKDAEVYSSSNVWKDSDDVKRIFRMQLLLPEYLYLINYYYGVLFIK